VKSNWTKVRLDECAEIVGGSTPSTSVKAYWDGDVCWATPKDLSELDGPYISDTPRKLTRAGLESCAATILPVGSVLFSSRAPIGHVAVNTVPMATNQGFKSFVPKPERTNAKFLYWWLRVNRAYLERLGNGATFKEVSKSIVSRIEIPLPPLAEQRRIAEVLDRTEGLRATRRAALAQLNSLTQSLFLDLFGDPISNPHNWPQENLETLFHFRTGKLDSNAAVASGQYPFFTCSREDFRIDTFAFDCEALLLAGNNASADYSVKHYKGKFNAYQRTYAITLRDEHNSYDYAQFVLEHRLAELKRISKGTSTKYLTMELLNRIRVPLPPTKLQREFARRVKAVEKLKTAHRASLAELDTLFACLQHRAFNGELFDEKDRESQVA